MFIKSDGFKIFIKIEIKSRQNRKFKFLLEIK